MDSAQNQISCIYSPIARTLAARFINANSIPNDDFITARSLRYGITRDSPDTFA
jgi:hypothetical protein